MSARAATRPHRLGFLMTAAACSLAPVSLAAQSADALAAQVEIRRTEYGVPHILAPHFRGAGFGLAFAEAEDHGDRVFEGLLRARGVLSTVKPSEESVRSDPVRRITHEEAEDTYPRLSPDLRDFMEGFAEGINYYLRIHPGENPGGRPWRFTGVDVHALHIGTHNRRLQRRFQEVVERTGEVPRDTVRSEPFDHPDDGSNAWALAPERTRSGHAILMRNPHLAWDAGYYEAHLTVPGRLDFYGDFRIGGLFGIICGFNRYLGWTTTNNAPDLDEIYELELVPGQRDQFRLDGRARPISGRTVTIEVADSVAAAEAEAGGPQPVLTPVSARFELTELGPVIHRTADRIYVMRSSDDGEWRRAEQLFAMMRAESLEAWKAAMRMQAISSSNYTYADRAGNIFYVWNAKLPALPHDPKRLEPVPVRRSGEVWRSLVPFDALPQLLNPSGGYLRNENDPPYFTNLNQPLDPAELPANLPEVRLRLRSQHSLDLLHNERRFALEDVVETKHSMRMLLAERLVADLVNAVRVADSDPDVRAAADLLDGWDRTAARDSRGGVLFEIWWRRYRTMADTAGLFREAWTPERPVSTPRGLGELRTGVQAFAWAVRETARRHGAWDVSWGEVHRVRAGAVDVPVGGCPGDLGCFRVLSFERAEDGALVANRGDGWMFAVEFADVPRAYSVLAYGQSSRPESPHFADQAALFAANATKPVAFTEAQIEAALIERYRPGAR